MEAAEFADVLEAVRRFVRTEVVPREEEIKEADVRGSADQRQLREWPEA